MVNPGVVLIHADCREARGAQIVVPGQARGGQRNYGKQGRCYRVHRRDRIVCERGSRARIVDGNPRSREVTRAFQSGRNVEELGLRLANSDALVIEEEKRLVFLNRTAKARAELVLLVG